MDAEPLAVVVRPLTPSRWPDLEALFEAQGCSIPRGCWGDWEQDGRTGAVPELEGGMPVAAHWRGFLMLGGRLLGEGVKSTYGKRVELTARYRF